MDEFALIETLIAPRAGRRDDVELGIGDDAAVVQAPAGMSLVMALDTLVAGVHFPDTLAPAHIGARLAGVNLSDLAAMGATPCWATLGLTLPVATRAWLEAFLDGLMAPLREHGVQLIGGDTTRGPLTLTLHLVGTVPAGTALTRGGGRPGDLIYVSGTLGDAAAGLAQLDHPEREEAAATAFLRERFNRPSARVALGRELRGLASACIDVSDGLVADLGHLCRQSHCAAEVQAAHIPLSPAMRAVMTPAEALALALTGGDDYELCFTVPPDKQSILLARVGSLLPLTRIGVMTQGSPEVFVRDEHGAPVALARTGYRHFE